MVFLFSKIFSFLFKPLVWICLIFIVACLTKSSIKRNRFLLLDIVLLLLFSNSYLVGKFFNAYEAEYPPVRKYDVGIVLGGFSDINNRNGQVAFGSTADRFLQAISLYQKGVIKKILITSGSANLIDKEVKEADLIEKYLADFKLPDSIVLIENQSRSTIENAKFSSNLINSSYKNSSILVITSAWHIPRAKLSFDKYFRNIVEYYPTNHIGKTEYDLSDFIVPSAEALSSWNILIKEWVGLFVDRFRS